MSKNRAEEIVHRFFRRGFLSLWSYANPLGKSPGKELCDTLIVCDPEVVIVSVKDCELKKGGAPEINALRWRRNAIEESVNQIYGAERWVRAANRVVRSDGALGLPLPSPRRIHRVAVAVGGLRQVPIESREFGRGFVHVFDEGAFEVILGELNTVTDLVTYLTAKEELYGGDGVQLEFDGGEEDLLAIYLHRGREFPPEIKGKGRVRSMLWSEFSTKEEYKAKRIDDRASFIWDGLIDHVAKGALGEIGEAGEALTNVEIALRVMAREDRFARRLLATAFGEFVEQCLKIESRLIVSPSSGVAYVFLGVPYGTDVDDRRADLANRCFVARGKNDKRSPVVLGIVTERPDSAHPARSLALDLYCLRKEEWTEEDQRVADGMQKELGYFSSPLVSEQTVDEYPRRRR